jgi:hypothetical protein
MWQRVGLKLFLLSIVFSIGLTWPLMAEIKPEDKCYALDEKTNKLESGNMVTSTNYIWLPFMTPLAFDKKPCDPAVEPLCQNTAWEGSLYYGLYHVDTTGGAGFQASRNWRLCACDRNGDGLFNNADLQLPFLANTDTSDPDMKYSYQPEPDYLVTHPGLNASFQVLSPKDIETPCSTGNCATEIITTMYISLDSDGVGGLPPVAEPAGGLCFYAEGRKPLESVVSWIGNVQARVFSVSGEKTLNFSFEAPTPVIVSSFTAYSSNGQSVVQWETSSELNTAGFYLYRKSEESGEFNQVNQQLLPGLGLSARGGTYRYVDPDVYPGKTYVYNLREIQVDGKEKLYGPFTVIFGDPKGLVPPYVDGYEKQERPIPPDKLERLSAAKASHEQGLALANGRTGDVIKIFVQKTGLYFVSSQEIAGILATPVQRVTELIKSGNLSLTCQGQEVAWLAAEDNVGLYFYGEGIDSFYTTDNVYWLRSGRGQRMTAIQGSGPAPSSSPTVFAETVHFEQDKWPALGLFKDPNADFWMWDLVYGAATLNYKFQTPGASRTGAASLTLRLHGDSDTAAYPDHHVVVSLNGNLLGQGYFDGIAPYELNLTVNPSFLKDTGENTLEVVGKVDPGVPSWTMFFVDSFDVTYQRLYQAVSDSLTLRGDTNPVVTVSGFSQEQVSVFDVSAPATPRRVTATTIEPYGGSYRVAFTPASPGSRYLVVAPSAINRPVSLIADLASTLRQKSNGADYLIIAPGEFKAGAQALADYRSQHGLTCKVVDLEDIYDEFAQGLADPLAIRSFLAYAATQWRTGPRYIVLVGDASIDMKDVWGFSENFVPTLLVGTPDGLFGSDGALADVYGQDGISDIAIGRLPVVSNSELEQMVAKIVAYEKSDGPWKKRVLMAADKTDPNAGNFKADSEDVRTGVPADFSVDTVYMSDLSTAAARAAILAGINDGAYLVNYFGHGSWWGLSQEGLLTIDDIPSLVNGDRLPVVAAMTCGAGWFEMFGGDCLAEGLLLSGSGGAIAVWSPTGWSYNAEAKILDKGLFQGMFSQEKLLGNIIQNAVDSYPSNGGTKVFMQQIYNLLGDPALQVW